MTAPRRYVRISPRRNAQFFVLWCHFSALTALGFALGWVVAQWMIGGH